MDEHLLELAESVSQAEREGGVARARAALAPQQHPDFDGEHCVEPDCGDDLPAQRIALGRIRCTDCESRRERRKVGFGVH